MVSPHPVRARRPHHVSRPLVKELGAAPIKLLRGLDGPHSQGRASPCKTAAAPRRRAQHRRHHLGLARRQALSPRPDRLGSSLSNGQCLRSGIRLHRVQRRHHSHTRSENTHRHEFQAPVRDADTPEALGRAIRQRKTMQPSPYWGDEKIWNSKANNHNGMFDK